MAERVTAPPAVAAATLVVKSILRPQAGLHGTEATGGRPDHAVPQVETAREAGMMLHGQ